MEKKDEVWQVVSSKYLFRRPWLTVRCDDMLLPNGNHIPEYYILEYPDWVNTIAITKEGKFVFVRQFRPGIGKQLYELCAGVCEKTLHHLFRRNGSYLKRPDTAKATGKSIW